MNGVEHTRGLNIEIEIVGHGFKKSELRVCPNCSNKMYEFVLKAIQHKQITKKGD